MAHIDDATLRQMQTERGNWMNLHTYSQVLGKPLPVTIVRPYQTPRQNVIIIVTRVIFVLLVSWVLMLAVPFAFGWHPGYWQTLVGYCVLRLVFTSHDYGFWSQAGTKPTTK